MHLLPKNQWMAQLSVYHKLKKGGKAMGLQNKLDEYKKSFLEKAPPEAVGVIQRATEDLKNSGILQSIRNRLGQI